MFANKGGITNLAVGVTGYIGVMYYLVRSLQGSSLIIVNTAWDGLSTIIEDVYAFIILGERYEFLTQYLGLILVITGLYFLKIPWHSKQKFSMPMLFSKKQNRYE
jgi:multidrug transporter EmrE-like cation transporter